MADVLTTDALDFASLKIVAQVAELRQELNNKWKYRSAGTLAAALAAAARSIEGAVSAAAAAAKKAADASECTRMVVVSQPEKVSLTEGALPTDLVTVVAGYLVTVAPKLWLVDMWESSWNPNPLRKRRAIDEDGSSGGPLFLELCRNRWRLVQVCRVLSESATKGSACGVKAWYASIYGLPIQSDSLALQQFRERLRVSQAGATARLLQKDFHREEELHNNREAVKKMQLQGYFWQRDVAKIAKAEARTDSIDTKLVNELAKKASQTAIQRMIEVQTWAATFPAAVLFVEKVPEGEVEEEIPEILLEEMVTFTRRLFRGQKNVPFRDPLLRWREDVHGEMPGLEKAEEIAQEQDDWDEYDQKLRDLGWTESDFQRGYRLYVAPYASLTDSMAGWNDDFRAGHGGLEEEIDRAHCSEEVKRGEIQLLGDNSVYESDKLDNGPSTWGILHLDFDKTILETQTYEYMTGFRKGLVADYVVPLTKLASPGSTAHECVASRVEVKLSARNLSEVTMVIRSEVQPRLCLKLTGNIIGM